MAILFKIYFILIFLCKFCMASEYAMNIFELSVHDPLLQHGKKANIRQENTDLLCTFEFRKESREVSLDLCAIWQLQQLNNKVHVLQFTQKAKNKSQKNKSQSLMFRCLFEKTAEHQDAITTYISCFTKDIFLSSENQKNAKNIRFLYDKFGTPVIPKEVFITNQNNKLEIMLCRLYSGATSKKTIFLLSDMAVAEFIKKFEKSKKVYYVGISKKCYMLELNKEQRKIIQQTIEDGKKKATIVQNKPVITSAPSKQSLPKKNGMLSLTYPEGLKTAASNCRLFTNTWELMSQGSAFEVLLTDEDKAIITTLKNVFYIVADQLSYLINEVDDNFLLIPDKNTKNKSTENDVKVNEGKKAEEKVVPFYKQYIKTIVALSGITLVIGCLIWYNK